ncbi:MAG: aminotransferase class V-fold PLP-dependent enzyme, partial [Rhodospirillales bacterium]|nr:aminotransferase class V-fold PLP-dependent enzyme [Rhodospirillales bacterium]
AVYRSVARLLNVDSDEIALLENATVAWDKAFYSLPFNEGDRILTCQSEYGANYVAYLQMAKRIGVKIDVIPNDEFGAVDPVALDSMIDDQVKLISITHIPTNGGLVNPAEAIGVIARKHNILYLLDACQSAGQMPLDVQAIGCDMLSAAGRKFLRAPRGTGFLYVRRSLLQTLEPSTIDHFAGVWVDADNYELRPDARRFELWENNYAARMGLGVAVDYALDLGLDVIYARAKSLADRLRTGLEKISGVTVQDLGREPCAIVTFSFDKMVSEQIAEKLSAQNINASVSDSETTRLDAIARNLPHLVRLSPHYYNTEDEIDTVLDVLQTVLK